MSTIINATTTNGVVIQPDNSGSLVLQTNSGTTALTISTAQNATFAGTVTLPTGTIYPLVSGTAVASTSGTSIDFTSIPSWVKRITVMFNNVSLSGTANLLVQIGNTTPTTSGYTSNTTFTATVVGIVSSTAGIVIQAASAAYQTYGTLVFTNISGNIWTADGVLGNSTSVAFTINSSGIVTLASALNMIRITSTNGTDTFDAGSVNILYE